MRLRPAFSPAGTTGSTSLRCVGISPTRSSDGAGNLRGAPWISRRGSCCHARQNGVNTAYGLSLPMSAMKFPGVRRGSTPASRSAATTRASRARANGETSDAKYAAVAPCSRASFGSSCSGFPRTTTSLPSSDARSSRRQSNRNAVRLGDVSSSRSSSTNTGTIRSCASSAARSGG